MPLGRYLGSQIHSYEDYDPKKVLSLEMISLDISGKGLGWNILSFKHHIAQLESHSFFIKISH